MASPPSPASSRSATSSSQNASPTQTARSACATNGCAPRQTDDRARLRLEVGWPILAGLVLVAPFALSVRDVTCHEKQTGARYAASPAVVGARDTRARSYNRDAAWSWEGGAPSHTRHS